MVLDKSIFPGYGGGARWKCMFSRTCYSLNSCPYENISQALYLKRKYSLIYDWRTYVQSFLIDGYKLKKNIYIYQWKQICPWTMIQSYILCEGEFDKRLWWNFKLNYISEGLINVFILDIKNLLHLRDGGLVFSRLRSMTSKNLFKNGHV